MWEYLKNLIPTIPKLVSWEHRKPLWPEMRVFLWSISPGDGGAAQRVWISCHSLRVHTTISGMFTSHTPPSPPSQGDWRAKRWDFSKRDPKCDNSCLVEQLTQHLGLGGFTFQQEKKAVSDPGLPKLGLFNIHQRLTQKSPFLFFYQYSPPSCFLSHFLLLVFPPRTFLQRIQLKLPSLGESEWTPHWSCLLFERAFFSQINPAKPRFLGKSRSFCYQVITPEKWSCPLWYFFHPAQC